MLWVFGGWGSGARLYMSSMSSAAATSLPLKTFYPFEALVIGSRSLAFRLFDRLTRCDAEGFLDDTHALEVTKRARDMAKDKYLKAKLKAGIVRMADEKAAFDRAT